MVLCDFIETLNVWPSSEYNPIRWMQRSTALIIQKNLSNISSIFKMDLLGMTHICTKQTKSFSTWKYHLCLSSGSWFPLRVVWFGMTELSIENYCRITESNPRQNQSIPSGEIGHSFDSSSFSAQMVEIKRGDLVNFSIQLSLLVQKVVLHFGCIWMPERQKSRDDQSPYQLEACDDEI